MYQAAICEDEPDMLTHIRLTLSETFQSHHVPVSFDSFPDGTSFLSMFENFYHYDMIFMDIEMPDINGIEVCRKIREISPDTLVVFISNKDELVFQSIEVQPFRFIRKSQYHSLLPSLVDSLLQELTKRTRNLIQITEPTSRDLYSFDINTIYYIEAQGKYCNIITNSASTLVQCKLSTLEDQLSIWNFVKPHRSYLVNCRYIFLIQKKMILLTNQAQIPISKNRVEETRQLFLVYTSKGLS